MSEFSAFQKLQVINIIQIPICIHNTKICIYTERKKKLFQIYIKYRSATSFAAAFTNPAKLLPTMRPSRRPRLDLRQKTRARRNPHRKLARELFISLIVPGKVNLASRTNNGTPSPRRGPFLATSTAAASRRALFPHPRDYLMHKTQYISICISLGRKVPQPLRYNI